MTSHRDAAAKDQRSVDSLVEDALVLASEQACWDLAAALQAPGMSVISEIKRRSPSAGDLNIDLDPAVLAGIYADAGAAALSVLTDVEFFGGHPNDLSRARQSVQIPVLRKDFTVDERDVADARLMGADAILLIVAGLSDRELQRFHDLAHELGMHALVEVHDSAELERANAIDGIRIIGVNQRNLHTFEVTDAARELRDSIRGDVVAVCESGIQSVEDAQRMSDLGYDAILVGTSLVTAGDPGATLRQFASVRS